MSVSAVEFREEKLSWLLRPIGWASHICSYGTLLSALMWINGDVSIEVIVGASIAALAITAGLLIWGIARVQNAVRGRY